MTLYMNFPPTREIIPQQVGWKIYNLYKTSIYCKGNKDEKILIPSGIIISSDLYDKIKNFIKRCYIESLKYSIIESDKGVLEELGDKLGEEIIVDKDDKKEKIESLVENLIEKHGIDKILEIVIEIMESTDKSRKLKIPLVNKIADYLMFDKFAEIQNEVSNSLSPYIERILSYIKSIFEQNAHLYLRSSTYLEDIKKCYEFHTGNFISIIITDYDELREMMRNFYLQLFDSRQTIAILSKAGIENFSLSILVQSVILGDVISGNITTTKSDEEESEFKIRVEYINGVNVTKEALKNLIEKLHIREIEFFKIPGVIFSISGEKISLKSSKIYEVRFVKERLLDVLEDVQQPEEYQNVTFIISKEDKRISVKRISIEDIRDISKPLGHRMSELLACLYLKFEEEQGPLKCLRTEIVIDDNDTIYIIQCDPILKEG